MCRRAPSIYERKKGGTRVAAYLKQDNGKDAPKTVIFDGGEANFYEPTIKQLTVIRAGANRSQWESFLTLGFGGSGTRAREKLESEPAGHGEHGWHIGGQA